jgi:hypothetical protein
MRSLKHTIKRTFMYEKIKQLRARNAARLWTAHDQEMLEFYAQFLSAGDLCFDVGANVGNRTKIFLKWAPGWLPLSPRISVPGL